MKRFKIEQSTADIVSQSGLALKETLNESSINAIIGYS